MLNSSLYPVPYYNNQTTTIVCLMKFNKYFRNRKPVSWQPFCPMQDGGHIGLEANGNIVFLIAYTISFSKMYSFHTLHKNPTTVTIQT